MLSALLTAPPPRKPRYILELPLRALAAGHALTASRRRRRSAEERNREGRGREGHVGGKLGRKEEQRGKGK